MKIETLSKILLLVTLFVEGLIYAQSSNIAPILAATGNQIYCPGSSIKIVTDMTIVDPDDIGVTAVYIQISSGYVYGQDQLVLTGFHPTINSNWNSTAGKLILSGTFGQPSYIDLIAAIKDVEFYSIAAYPSGVKTFSISIGQANYLPSNGHYYQYIANLGITWNDAKIAAQTNFYYGIQGYLVTITAADEAQIGGEQASGAGWIGGSDEQTEGIWKWMTGPEVGTNMIFTFWNTNEPNNLGEEDYAHITAPGVGITGAWNDLSNTGDTSGDYQPKGYIVEYGGMPGDPIIQIATSTTITIPSITAIIEDSDCDFGILSLQAATNIGTVNWYTTPTGGIPIATGNSFTTPLLNNTTIYYVDSSAAGCPTGTRTPITATINNTPIVTAIASNTICENSTAMLTASTTAGMINWYSTPSTTIPIATGANFTTPILTQNTTYYVSANNNGCIATRIPVTIVVYPIPVVVDENKIICENSSLLLEAGILNVSYLWSTGETTPTITISNPGTYTVRATSLSSQNCWKTKTIVVTEHYKPLIQDVTIINTTATINTIGFGDFEYSVNGINYQDSNIFSLNEGGLYTAFVREKNNCGNDYKPFIIVTIPKFFTPNNDGVNDYWTIKQLIYYPKAEVKIFDRFGKFITILKAQKYIWDGTLNEKLLNSDDYWYSFKIDENSPEIKGHFSMKR
jgi:gliding motility-associated-like protein